MADISAKALLAKSLAKFGGACPSTTMTKPVEHARKEHLVVEDAYREAGALAKKKRKKKPFDPTKEKARKAADVTADGFGSAKRENLRAMVEKLAFPTHIKKSSRLDRGNRRG